MIADIKTQIARFGTPESSIKILDEASWENIAYLDLIQGVSLDWERQHKIPLKAVVEYEDKPLLYIVNETSLTATAKGGRDKTINILRAKLAFRGEVAWLALMEPGQLTLYHLDHKNQEGTPTIVNENEDRAKTFIQDLALGADDAVLGRQSKQSKATGDAFHQLLFKLITGVSSSLLKLKFFNNKYDDVLSLIGRALFARFLIDRGFLSKRTLSGINNPHECFSNAKNATKTCKWLDETFNGELLPLAGGQYSKYFDKIKERDKEEAFKLLSRVLEHAPGGQLSFDWRNIDFAHVPIGLLSEVYEQYAHQHGPTYKGESLASLESIHYTPKSVADYMVNEAFAGLQGTPADKARILDPTVGCGVFLVLAYRRLIKERWKCTGKRPTRRIMREILYSQIYGFDINDSALKLTALSLYLTVLELGPGNADVTGLKFRPLQGKNLILARGEDEKHPNPHVLGSIGPAITEEHNGKYDIVIGNPPWTAWKSTLNKEAEAVVQSIADKRWGKYKGKIPDVVKEYKNPDNVPDLPIVWRATQWAKRKGKEKGVIAFALHARLLFKQSPSGTRAREALFRSLHMTGILNGAALRKTEVWPNTDAPWCLLFARNRIPDKDQTFMFISPDLDKDLNNLRGLMRIDYESAEPVRLDRLLEYPELLKVIFRGDQLDADLIRKIQSKDLLTIDAYWKRNGLYNGNGYIIGLRNKSAKHLHDKPHLSAADDAEKLPKFKLKVNTLPSFSLPKLEAPRKLAIYRAPLLILPESIKSDRNNGCGLYASSDVVYSQSFSGYSAHEFTGQDREGLVRYLHILTASNLFQYHCLLTSPRFGVERPAILKKDVDSFPIVPFEDLEPEIINRVRSVSKDIEECENLLDHGPEENKQMLWNEVDRLVAEIYGLNESDCSVIRDTLSVSLPDTSTTKNAIRPPTLEEMEHYVQVLQKSLTEDFALLDVPVAVSLRKTPGSSWKFIDVSLNQSNKFDAELGWIEKLADNQGATRIIIKTAHGNLAIGQLTQYRYWTESRARLCGLEIVQKYSDKLLAEIAA